MPTPISSTPSVGQSAFEPILVTKKIGSGTFGDVYEGRHLGNPIALKIVPHTGVKSTEKIQRLKNESDSLMQCSQRHTPHVIKILNYHQSLEMNRNTQGDLEALLPANSETLIENRCDVMMMEMAQEGTLGDRLKRYGKLPEQECKNIARQILETLKSLHEETGMVHRDIKPDNLVFHEGEWKLIDFGLRADNTRPKTPVGSWKYLAPDILLCHQADSRYTCKVDLWSLGILLVHAATGTIPFCGKNTTPKKWLFDIRKHVQQQHNFRLPEYLSPDFNDFVTRLLWPSDVRPTAAEALKHHWLTGEIP
jgi:serine/threonine protein kinase